MKETDKKLKEDMARKGREAISNVRESKPDQETIEDRAKEYYDENHIPRDSKLFLSGEYYYLESLIEMMADFHKQELERLIPSDEERKLQIERKYIEPNRKYGTKIPWDECNAFKNGCEWIKQQILKNIK